MGFSAVALALLLFSRSLDQGFEKTFDERKSHLESFSVDPIACETGRYPPTPKQNISQYTINLDLPPQQRWTELVTTYSEEIQSVLQLIKDLVRPILGGFLIELVDKYFPDLVETLPKPYSDEIKAIAKALDMEIGEIGLYNVFYEIFTLCTSVVAQSEGRLYHARNLDFGLLMGWNRTSKTWEGTELLRRLTVQLDFQKGGETIFKTVQFAGYIGVLTGMKPNSFTLTVDERFKFVGGYIGIVEWILGRRDGKWMSFLTRDIMENANTFEEAKKILKETPLLSPVYFILGGNQPGQGAVITRGLKSSDVWNIGLNDSSWYLVETNYDHWVNPPSFDDRRTPAKKCLNNLGQQNLSIGGLFNVLSTIPVLNKLTVYTAVMECKTGHIENYLQFCLDESCPYI